MRPLKSLSRRDLLKASVAAAGTALLPHGVRSAAAAAAPTRHALRLGLATYSFNTLTVDQIIPLVRLMEFETVTLFRAHAPWNTGTVEECRTAVQKFADAGIRVTSTGVVNLPNEEAPVRKAFENVRGAGLRKFVGRPTPDALPLVDKFVKEFDVVVAIHNHGPTDLYPQGADVLRAVAPYDRRIGLCLDVGHGWLADEDPAATIRAAGDRLHELHLKDTRGPRDGKFTDSGPVAVGRGMLDFKAIVQALVDTRFAHDANFEYEQPVPNKVPGVAESLGYIRGLLAAL